MTKSAKLSPLVFVAAAALLWSTGGFFIKWNNLSGMELSFFRSVFALLVVAWFTRREGFGANGITVAAAFLYAAVVILFVSATKQTTAANAIFLQYTSPMYLLIFEPLVYKEKFRSRDLITVLVCLGGMTLFFVGQLRPQDITGNILALASGLGFAAYLLFLRHPKARQVNRASSVIYGNLIVILVAAPWGLSAIASLDRYDTTSVIYLGVVQLGLSYVFFTHAMARGVRSLDAGIICYIEPVLNPVWVFLGIGERPSRWALLGGSIIIVAVIVHMLLDAQSKRKQNYSPLESAHS